MIFNLINKTTEEKRKLHCQKMTKKLEKERKIYKEIIERYGKPILIVSPYNKNYNCVQDIINNLFNSLKIRYIKIKYLYLFHKIKKQIKWKKKRLVKAFLIKCLKRK